MTTASMIDARAVASALVADLDDARGDLHGDGLRSRVDLPDGRTATLRVRFDPDAGIGEGVFGGNDECFGRFEWRGRNRFGEDRRAERPDGFDGNARAFNGWQAPDRIDGAVWWQPPADILAERDPAYRRAMVDKLAEQVRAWIDFRWFHVGLIVTVDDPGGDAGGEASLWAVEYEFPDSDGSHIVDYVAELLAEAGIEQASTASVARWARDPLEAVARRMTDADESSDAYARTLRHALAWWRDVIEPMGDWDTYAGPMTDRIEEDFNVWAFERLVALGCEAGPSFDGVHVTTPSGDTFGPFDNYGAALADPRLSLEA